MVVEERYPIGEFDFGYVPPREKFGNYIASIEALPEALEKVVSGLDEAQLDTPYRVGGWNIRQVVHHLADSHINAVMRFKLALTEETPAIKPYYEARWAELADGKTGPLAPSLNLLQGLHSRWVLLLNSMSSDDFKRSFHHPENGLTISLATSLACYAWHGQHHLAHIERLKKRNGW